MTNWMYCMTTKKKPKFAKNRNVTPTEPVAKSGRENNRTSSSGNRWRNSTTVNTAANARPAAIDPQTTTSAHPRAGASITPNTKAAIADPMSAAPAQSTGAASSSRDDDTVQVSTNSTAPAPTNAQKIDCHDQKCNRIPVTRKPMTAPEPATPAQIPTALVRSARGYAAVKSDSVAGMTNAAPAPATALAMISCTGLSRKIGTSEARVKIAKPMRRAPRLPYRSPIAPAGSSMQASARV